MSENGLMRLVELGVELAPSREAAFEMVRLELNALPPSRVRPVNIDITAAYMTVLGCQPALAKLRADFEDLTRFDMNAYDKLVIYAQAALFAHVQLKIASEPIEPVPPLVEALTKIHATLMQDTRALVKHELIDAASLKHLRGPVGYTNLTFDVTFLCALLHQSWEAIAGRTAVDLRALAVAEELALRLMTAVGVRDHGTPEKKELIATRNKAFTLFVNAYAEVRRGAIFLRWYHGDADRFAPSLYRGHGGSRKKTAGRKASNPSSSDPSPK